MEQHTSVPKIPGYVLTHPLGQGAFAEVWKGWQVRTRKWVAEKVFTQRQGVNWLFLQRELERLIRLDRFRRKFSPRCVRNCGERTLRNRRPARGRKIKIWIFCARRSLRHFRSP
ncbi:MAG: hypothetical protein CO113_07070 [Elusimicrobia bacterium CG_4_9_14_3_um_filter_62_55]|nr:MAG: hypothetical protein CO113_07070 [Elusimicrobia bacterium CG_4_9_14_3_um_filter_62_55]